MKLHVQIKTTMILNQYKHTEHNTLIIYIHVCPYTCTCSIHEIINTRKEYMINKEKENEEQW